ncbi:MAG: hypothetical protein ACOYOS_04220 [Syntrophales bacterium]
MTIEWIKPPLAKISLDPGSEWAYTLPLKPKDDMEVNWTADFVTAKAIQVDVDDPRQIRIALPRNLDACFGEILYTIINGDEAVKGNIIVRIMPVAPLMHHLPPVKPPVREEKKDQENQEEINPVPDEKLKEVKAEIKLQTVKPDDQHGQLKLQPLTGQAYFIEILRNGKPLKRPKTIIIKNKTTRIGKASSRYGIPDLDLTEAFESAELADLCSRQQAEVYWRDGYIYVKTMGTKPLKLQELDGSVSSDPLPGEYCWQPNKILAVPGKLRLALREEKGDG